MNCLESLSYRGTQRLRYCGECQENERTDTTAPFFFLLSFDRGSV